MPVTQMSMPVLAQACMLGTYINVSFVCWAVLWFAGRNASPLAVPLHVVGQCQGLASMCVQLLVTDDLCRRVVKLASSIVCQIHRI